MNRHLLHLNPFYSPEDAAGGGGKGGDEGTDELSQDLADLGEETPTEEDENADDDEESSEEGDEGEEGDEDAEGDEEDEEADEDEDDKGEKKGKKKADEEEGDDEQGGKKATFKAVKAAFPDLFKKFPELKKSFFLAPQFLEVYPDVETAKEAATKATEFDALEGSLVGKGDPTLLLKTLSENNPKAFKQVVENLPSVLRTLDESAYVALSTPIIEELLYFASKHGEKMGNKNLQLAAKHIANFVFTNGGEIPDVSKRLEGKAKEPSEAEKELKKERDDRANEKFEGAVMSVADLLTVDINKIITNKLDGVTAFERKQIIKETRSELDRVLSGDKSFQATLRGLWKRASEANYSEESKSRVRRAWLDRARTLAPGIRNRLRREALDARTNEGSEEEGTKKVSAGKKRTFDSGKGKSSGKQGAGVLDPKKIDWRKTTDLDILG